jgi:hypothetical protein
VTTQSQLAPTILQLFPPGRCRRILKHLAEHREQIDDTSRCGELVFHLGTNRNGEGVVSTAGPHWKAEPIDL